MKPYGRNKKTKFPGKTDCHPQKGWVNWWENAYNNIETRSTMKRKWKKAAKRELDE